jgi:hypothetical protein
MTHENQEPENKILTPESSDVEDADEALADGMDFRDSPYHTGRRVSVATKMGVDVCWCCHRPVLAPSNYVDIPMKEALIRLCKNESCMISAARELMKQPKPFSVGGL